MRPDVYTPSFRRALLSSMNNGFFARDLDADDHAFLERVRERGNVDCGSLAWPASTACTHSDDVIQRTALIEELDFWTQPWGVDASVERRIGKPYREHLAELSFLRELSREEREHRRAARAADNAAMQAELERERAAWEAERKRVQEEAVRRLLRAKQADLEWEAAAPPPVPTWQWREEWSDYLARRQRWHEARKSARHYVPEWKRNEKRDKRAARFYAENVKRWRRYAKLSVKLARVVTKGRAEEEARNPLGRKMQPGECEPGTCSEIHCCPVGICKRAVEQLKQLLATHINGSFPHEWTVDQLMAVTKCTDREFLLHCANELVSSGRIRTKP